MSFIFPLISSISIAITCGLMLYKYFNNTTITDDNKIPDNNKTIDDNKAPHFTGLKDLLQTTDSSGKYKPDKYAPLETIIIEPPKPTLIVPNKEEYTEIPSDEYDMVDDI